MDKNFYAVTISMYASEEIKQKAERGETWYGRNTVIVKTVHTARGKKQKVIAFELSSKLSHSTSMSSLLILTSFIKWLSEPQPLG